MTPAILTEDDRNSIRTYFLDLRVRYAVILLILGLVLVELTLGRLLLLAGLIWLGAALAFAAKRPSEKNLDQLVSRDVGSLVEVATRALDRPEGEIQVPPLVLLSPTPLASHATELRSARPRIGRDSRLRSPVSRAVILLPMEDQLGIYSCDQNFVSGRISNVAVEEHHYRDIVSVRMEEDVTAASGTPSRGGERTINAVRQPAQRLSIELANGRTVSVPVLMACQAVDGRSTIGPTELERTLAVIRVLLRDAR